jgi:hypothetical protein
MVGKFLQMKGKDGRVLSVEKFAHYERKIRWRKEVLKI